MPDVNLNPKKRRKSLQVIFNDEEEIINPGNLCYDCVALFT